MQSLPADIYSVATVREIDRKAIEEQGIAGYALMTAAAEAAVAAARQRFPEARHWQVVCGGGNNAGDGYVVARLAAAAGLSVSLLTLVDPGKLHGDARKAYEDCIASGGQAQPFNGALDAAATLLVDGILGSGLQRDVSGQFAEAVRAINAHPAHCVALDIPSGLHGDTGAVLGCAVHASLTVSFVGLKSGLFLGQGPDYCGELVFAGLGIPAAARQGAEACLRRLTDTEYTAALKPRRKTAHKGEFGHVLVVGGGPGMPGAARLCAEAALRSGAGRVTVASHPEHAAALVTARPELMFHAITDFKDIPQLAEKTDAIALGPGLGTGQWSRQVFAQLANDQRPCVCDADGLNLLAGSGARAGQRILTPHPGEAATLLQCHSRDIQADRGQALQELQARYGGVVVLKGAGTLVSAASGVPWLCTAGNPGMAAPGMGDVLTGIVAAFVANGMPLEQAAILAVEVHARAGDRAARAGQRGMLASDLLAELRTVLNP